MDLKEYIERFLDYSRTNKLSTQPFPEKEYKGFKIKVSFGYGNVSNSPSIVFLKGNNKPRSGIYPLLQYHKKLNLITIIFGVSEYFPPKRDWELSNNTYETIQELFTSRNLGKAKFPSSKVFRCHEVETLNIDQLVKDINDVLQIYAWQ